MYIIKRNGVKVDFNPAKIHTRIKKQAECLKVNSDEIFIKVTQGIADGMSTKQLDDLIAITCEGLTYKHPDYSRLAGNICISRHHKETEDTFIKLTKKLKNAGVLNDVYYEKVKEHFEIIQKTLDYSRDYMFDYFGWNKLKEIYLLKIREDIIERPQHMYMRVALTLTKTIEEAIKYYNLLSTHFISPATPIMVNAGTVVGQLASCNLNLLKGDDSESLHDSFKNICTSSSKGEGIGLAVHNIRSKESYVGKEGGKAGGLLKYLKIVNEGLRFWNQRGKRPGSCAIYLEPWHKDIFDLLDIRKQTGSDELRARDLFTALWIPDNFMRAVKNNEDWYLFCPNDILTAGLKPLYNIYGDKYEEEYNKAIQLGLGKKIKAQDVWLKILESQIETGTPYIGFKDAVNKKTNHKNIGVIKSSNLCIEIVQYTDPETVAICTLSSIPVQKYIVNNVFDFKLLYNSVVEITKALNVVIDNNEYSNADGRKGGREQRAIGIGIQGLADAFAILNYSFTSPEARKLNKDIAETIYFAALSTSVEVAKELNSTYHYYEGSPISEGIFQWNMWGLTEQDLSGLWDWKTLATNIKEFGVANSLTVAYMPTASSASLIGSNECFEPFNSNLYVRKITSGEFAIVNKYLVNDLEKENLWTDIIIKEIIANNGSIQGIPVISDELKLKYRTVYEIPQKDLIEMSAERAPFIDQSQSLNIFMANPTVGKLTSSHFKAWELGLKTGQYYLRSKPIENKAKHLATDLTTSLEIKTKSENGDFECFGCSA